MLVLPTFSSHFGHFGAPQRPDVAQWPNVRNRNMCTYRFVFFRRQKKKVSNMCILEWGGSSPSRDMLRPRPELRTGAAERWNSAQAPRSGGTPHAVWVPAPRHPGGGSGFRESLSARPPLKIGGSGSLEIHRNSREINEIMIFTGISQKHKIYDLS